MAILLPSLDKITKAWPQLGEALKQQQDYINRNVSQISGNKILPPPPAILSLGPIPATTVGVQTPTATPIIKRPPKTIVTNPTVGT